MNGWRSFMKDFRPLPSHIQGLCLGITIKCVSPVLPSNPTFIYTTERHFWRHCEMTVHPDDSGIHLIEYSFGGGKVFCPDGRSQPETGIICLTDGRIKIRNRHYR